MILQAFETLESYSARLGSPILCFTIRSLSYNMRVTSFCFDCRFTPLSKLVTLGLTTMVSDQIKTITANATSYLFLPRRYKHLRTLLALRG